ncbi:Uncharacterised protein [Escherichia coli]|uniref:Uncharacterized protein n=1 Tax=Escherichia coli TaxID=562 RepID=A0A376VZN0_ECOLX|nr:Uncharacterised protein [Escherichia coli]
MSEKKQKTLPSVHSSPLDGWTCVSPMLSVGFVLTVLVATILAVCGLYRYSGEQDERIAALEGQMKTYSDALALSGSELEPLRSRLAETEKQLKSVTERLTLLEQRPVLTEEEHARTGQMAASLHHCRPRWRSREKRFVRMTGDWRSWRRRHSPRYHRHLRKERAR